MTNDEEAAKDATKESPKIKTSAKGKINLIYAGLLLHSAGKSITENGVKKIADAAGEKVDDSQIKAFVAALEGIDIDDAISKAAMPTIAAAPAITGGAEKKEAKEEESEEDKEKKAEAAAEGLGALFG